MAAALSAAGEKLTLLAALIYDPAEMAIGNAIREIVSAGGRR